MTEEYRRTNETYWAVAVNYSSEEEDFVSFFDTLEEARQFMEEDFDREVEEYLSEGMELESSISPYFANLMLSDYGDSINWQVTFAG